MIQTIYFTYHLAGSTISTNMGNTSSTLRENSIENNCDLYDDSSNIKIDVFCPFATTMPGPAETTVSMAKDTCGVC